MLYLDASSIKAIDLSQGRKAELASLMAESYAHLSKFAEANATNIKEIRTRHRTGKVKYKADVRETLQKLEQIETEVICGYIKIAYSLCEAFYYSRRKQAPGTSVSDYLQEAAFAIFEAIYRFDGAVEFATYVHRCVKNRLVDYCRTDRMFSQIGRRLAAHRNAVMKLMEGEHGTIPFGEAVRRYQQQRIEKDLKPLSEHDIECVSDAYIAYCFDRSDIEDKNTMAMLVSPDDSQQDDIRLLHEVIASDGLSALEKRMIDHYLSNDTGWQTRLAKEKGVSKMTVSNWWAACRSKLKDIMDRKAA